MSHNIIKNNNLTQCLEPSFLYPTTYVQVHLTTTHYLGSSLPHQDVFV